MVSVLFLGAEAVFLAPQQPPDVGPVEPDDQGRQGQGKNQFPLGEAQQPHGDRIGRRRADGAEGDNAAGEEKDQQKHRPQHQQHQGMQDQNDPRGGGDPLAAPEVENDRRALNVFYGMRRARKEGRYMGLAPVAYINKTEENGRKYIAPLEPDASILRWAFEEIAKGIFNTEQIWKRAKEKGLKCSKNAFWQVIRNPLYCGKIFIPQFKDEESRFVKGQHKAIISEELYYEVQDILDGRGRNYRPKVKTLDEFPMRGFLICPECEKLLTGSKSKGRTKYYSYYHCVGACKHRTNAEIVNEAILKDLASFVPEIGDMAFYQELIIKEYLNKTNEVQFEKKEILLQIKDYEDRLSHTRDLLATRQIDADDYRDMKSQYSAKISMLESQLTRMNNDADNVQILIKRGVKRVFEIKEALKDGCLSEIRKDVGSIYPEKIVFEESKVRTARRNDFIQYINLINKKLRQNKNGTKVDFSTLSRQVGRTGFEPATPWSQTRYSTGLNYLPNCFLERVAKVKE